MLDEFRVDGVVGNKVEVTGMIGRVFQLLLRIIYVKTVLAVGCALHSEFRIRIRENYSFISFSNGANDRGDLRWQVPLRRHSTNHVVHTRQRVEALLARYGCIDGNGEKLHDLAMLMGGTADQSLHHDIPRQTTSFLPYDPKEEQRKQKEQMIMAEPPRAMVAASGWEFDRAAYNDAMGSPLAPVSILIGMGDEFKVLVGVQRNQVDQRG